MKLDFQTDDGIGTRANLGVIVLEADETLEQEFRRMIPNDGVALYVSRIPMVPEIRPNTLPKMKADLPSAAGLLPQIRFDAIGFGCTSAATVIGSALVAEAIASVRPDARISDPLHAIISAADALDAKKVGFVTPYVADVSAQMRETLQQAGIATAGFGSFEESDDRVVSRITPDSILSAIIKVAAEAPCDAVVVSCTNLRCLDIIEEAEARTGVPIITSNQALAWNMLHLADIATQRPEFGRLFTLTPPTPSNTSFRVA